MVLTKTGNKVVMEFDILPEEQERTKTGKNWKAYSSNGFQYEQGLGYSLNIIHSKR